MRRRWTMVLVTVALVIGLVPAVGAQEPLTVPARTAALGDSITAGFHTNCGLLGDCPEYSWSTGTLVQSHLQRLRSLDANVIAENLAVTGAKAADVAAQASRISSDTGYATLLIGANDACTDTVDQMTSTADFRASIGSALDQIHSNAPTAAVFVASVPDLYRLWEVGKDSGSARFTWWLYGICPSMLANPRSTRDADVARRQTVRQRVIDFNGILADECAAYPGTCRYDGGAVFGYPFELSHLSTLDYFHPNVAGQEILAEVTWQVGYAWSAGEPPPNLAPTADAGPDQTVTAGADGLATVTLDGSASSDPEGSVLSYSWTSVGNQIATSSIASISVGVGTHTIILTVTDDGGASDSDEMVVNVEQAPVEPPPPTDVVYVGDLDATSTSEGRTWTAYVTITVFSGSDPLAAAGVVGTWGTGSVGKCTTSGEGTCTVQLPGLRKNVSEVTFRVDGVDDPNYVSSANSDPDGDSDGTMITVLKP